MKALMFLIIPLIIGLMYSGCKDENITTNETMVSGDNMVPFKGSWEGTTETIGMFSRHVSCSGNCTHLGLYTADVYYDVTYTDPNNPFLGGLLINGTVTMIAANGDKLYLGNVHGEWWIVNPPVEPMVGFTGIGDVVGGTGRFAGATGHFEGSGKQNFTTPLQEAWFSWTGTMNY